MYSRQVEDQILEFGVSGKLIMNVLVMFDRQTDSLWSQLLGEAVQGEFMGTTLEYLPAWQTTWREWKNRYAETLALKKGFRGNSDPYFGYYASSSTGVIGETHTDPRLNPKQFVIGVEADGMSVAYPFSVLNEEPVVNDQVGNRPVLVIFDVQNGAGVVFSRSVDGMDLTFELTDEALVVIDEETGTIWDGFTGLALEGDLAGRQLERVKSTSSFWFGWKDFHPDTEVYGEGVILGE